jgi:hypothetical protein
MWVFRLHILICVSRLLSVSIKATLSRFMKSRSEFIGPLAQLGRAPDS